MKPDASQPTRLIEQNAALSRLLQDLLGEVPDDSSQSVDVGSECPAQPVLDDPVDAVPQDANEAGPTTRVPSWAAVSFRVLMFRVGGQRLAMPLIALHSVAPFDQQATALPGQPRWQMGVIQYRGQSLRIADTASLLGLSDGAGPVPRYLLVLDGGRLALACDRIDDAIEVEGEAVRWRQAEGPARWLVGILVESLAAMIDPWAIERKLGMDHA